MADVNTTGQIKIDADSGDAEKAFTKVANSIKEVEGAAEKAASGVESSIGGAIKNVNGLVQDSQGRWRTATAQYATHAQKAAVGVEGIGHAVGGLKGKFDAFGTMAVGAFLRVGAGAIELGAKIVGSVGKAMIGTVTLAGDFEGKMNSFAAATGDSLEGTGLSVEQFRKQFLDLGKELPVSTMEVADAATAMVKGGIDPATVAAGGLESTLKFAAAAGMELEQAANASVSQLAVFTKATDTAADKAAFLAKSQDLLVKAANASKADVASMSDAILMSAGTAKSAGVEYDDFVTSITMVTDAMPSAAEAGTSFKNMLTSLSPTSKKAKDAFADLGLMTFDTSAALKTLAANGITPASDSVEHLTEGLLQLAANTKMSEKEQTAFLAAYNSSAFYDAEGKFVGMRKAAELLQGSFKGLTEAERIRYAQAIFGNDAMGAANVLIDGGTAAYDKYADAITKANGVSEQSAATQQGLNFQIEQFKGSMEAMGITIGTMILPLATKLASWGVGIVNSLEPLFKFLSADSAIGLKQFENAISATFGQTTANQVVKFVQDAKLVLADIVGWVEENWPAIQSTISGVVNAIVSFIQTNWPTISTIIGEVITTISTFVNETLIPAINRIIPVIQEIVGWIQTNWPMISTIIGDVIGLVVGIINEYLLPVLNAILTAVGAVITFIVEHWPEIRLVISKVIDQIKIKLDSYIKLVKDAFDQAANAVKWMVEFVAAIAKGWEDLKKEITTAWQGIETWFNTLPQVLKTIGDNIMKGLIEGIKAQANAVFQAISGVVTNAIDGVKKLLNIQSPSKEFEDIGRMTMKGMEIGIEKGGDSVLAQVMRVAAEAVRAANQVVVGSTAHISPDAAASAAQAAADAARGRGEGQVGSGSAYVDAARASNHGEAAPAGLNRDDWDAHDRREAAQPAVIQVDGVTLASVLIGRMGQVLQQDARRYGG